MADEIDNNKLNAEPIVDDKSKTAEQEKEELQNAKEQADGVHSDGGGGNCPQGQIWDAECENCIPVNGSVDRLIKIVVKSGYLEYADLTAVAGSTQLCTNLVHCNLWSILASTLTSHFFFFDGINTPPRYVREVQVYHH